MPDPASLPTVEAILARRATRRFDPARPLSDALLRRLLGLATHAPSSYNLQPWRFLVVRSPSNRQKLRACAFNQPKVTEAPVVIIVLGYLHPHRSHLDAILATARDLGAATPEAVAEARGRASAALERLPEEARPLWATRSAMLAAATLMMAAESLGVASAPMEGFDPARVREAFGVPDDHAICCLVALGHAARVEPFPGRLGLEQVCFEEHFGQPWTLGEPPSERAAGLDSPSETK